jgi:hypothetical protein
MMNKGKTATAGKNAFVTIRNAPVTPLSPKELRRIDKRVEKRHKHLRKRYKEVRGKRVDWISHSIEEGYLYFTVRFSDKTALHLRVKPDLAVDGLELSDWKTGDEHIVRTYHRRQ